MTSTIQRAAHVLGRGDPKLVPEGFARPASPITIDPAKLARLGQVGRRTWWDWPEQRLELEEIGEPIEPNDPAVARTTYLKVPADGSYLLQAVRVAVRGTYAALVSGVPKVEKPPAAQRPIDVLATVDVFTGTGTRASAPWHIRGPENLIAKLARRGVGVHLSADRSALVVTGPGGRALNVYTEAARAAAPILLPWLRDGAVSCAVGKHKTPVPATTVAAGAPVDVPWCGAADCGPSK